MLTLVGAGAGRARGATGSEEAASRRLGVSVSATGGAVLLDHVHSVGMHRGDHSNVAVSATGAHPEISRLGVAGLGDALGVTAAHHVGVVVPDRSNAVLLVHVSLSELDALVGEAGGDGTTTGTASALILAVTLGRNAVVGGHGSATGRGSGARRQVVSAHLHIVAVENGGKVSNAGHAKSKLIVRDGGTGQNRENRSGKNELHCTMNDENNVTKWVLSERRGSFAKEVHTPSPN